MISMIRSLFHNIGKQADLTGALNCLTQLTLLLGGYSGDARRHNLTAFGNVTLQQAYIFIIDFRSILTLKRARFATTEKWTCHGLSLLFAWTAWAAIWPITSVAISATKATTIPATISVTAKAAAFTALTAFLFAHHN
jgi:hypothetical protein